MTENFIPCPACSTQIPFDPKQLLLGKKVSCPSCDVEIGLSADSNPIVEDALEQFNKLKDENSKN